MPVLAKREFGPVTWFILPQFLMVAGMAYIIYVFLFIELFMPQMDKVAFFSQLFWLMITFYGFYMITVKTHLPNLARILKVRKKKVEFAGTLPLLVLLCGGYISRCGLLARGFLLLFGPFLSSLFGIFG